ncbi:helix-turn-helix transcriptional regulator [Sphingomonas bisphenolicum]|nr:helix-turn-helix domain-containing protein [Sphingomonas bisphenolicum]
MSDDRLLSKSEVADRLSVHPATVDRWTKDGRITGKVRIGGRVGWRASAIQSLIATA